MKLGQALIELIIGVGMLGILLPALATGLITSSSGKLQSSNYQQANLLLKEVLESLEAVRNAGWDNISSDGVYHPEIVGNTWTLAPGPETIGIFTRSFVITSVQRLNGGIIDSGGVNDPSTKKVKVIVSWDVPRPSQVSATRYFTRYHDNFSQTISTQAEFDQGVKSSVATTNNNGGEVVLAGGGHGDWCQPDLTLAQVDLPKNGVANALTVIPATGTNPGYAFAGTGENSSGVSFAKLDITDTDPPTASIVGTFNGYKTNAVFGESNYAYLATDSNSKEVVIINLQTNPYTESGYFDAPGNTDANSLFVAGNYGYVTTGGVLRIFNLSQKTGSRSQISSRNLAGTGTKVVVANNYAFVSIAGSATELQIIDVSNPTNPVVVGQADVNGQAAVDVFINESATRAFLVTGTSSTQRELFVVDISTKTGNRPVLASVDTNGMNPKGVVAVTNNKVIVVGEGGVEYQVFTYDGNSSLTVCGSGLNVDAGINGIATVVQPSGSAFSYIITKDSSTEFKIIQGGPSGQTSYSGVYTSPVFDSGHSTAFNLISWTAENVNPPTTSLQFQVAVADPNPDCASANFVFVGPNGTSDTFFTAPGAFPLNDNGGSYQNPGQCFKYRAFFSTQDIGQSPVLNDVTWGYSP